MHTWKTHLTAMLERLGQSHPDSRLPETERLLASILEAESVRFQDEDGQALPADTTLSRLLKRAFTVSIGVRQPPVTHERTSDSKSDAARVAATELPSRFHPGEPPPHLADVARDPRFERFVHEFDRLEHGRQFMWAGYIVRDLLPRLGFPAEEAKVILDHMRADGMLTITKVPNPKHPDFPATGVQLNREHPWVQALLAGRKHAPPPVEASVAPAAPETPAGQAQGASSDEPKA